MGKKPTLKDVAALSGVSIATVSRVVNGKNNKSASIEVQNRVWDAVRQLNYVPNHSAQALKYQQVGKKKLTKTVTCIFSRTADTQTDPFFSEISRALEAELLKRDYIMKFVFSAQHLGCEQLVRLLKNENSSGVVILGKMSATMIAALKECSPHILYTGVNRLNEEIDQVICNGYKVGKLGINFLLEQGFKEMIYIGEVEEESRYQVFCDELQKLGIRKAFDQYTIECPFSAHAAYQALKTTLEQGDKIHAGVALFAGNDVTALGAMKALREWGLKVPEDVSVMSVDDIEMAQYAKPMLTTVRVNRSMLGRYAAWLIVERMEQGCDVPITIEIPPELVIRESVHIIERK